LNILKKQIIGNLQKYNAPKKISRHIEVRTLALVLGQYFKVLEKYGVGRVLSRWTWLPPLWRQCNLNDGQFLNAGKPAHCRADDTTGMRYEEAYAKAYPFNKVIDGMLTPQMIEDTAKTMAAPADLGAQINVVINNRAGGNAPEIAQKVSERFLETQSSKNRIVLSGR